jgi:outer membrane protein assembly factor BamB
VILRLTMPAAHRGRRGFRCQLATTSSPSPPRGWRPTASPHPRGNVDLATSYPRTVKRFALVALVVVTAGAAALGSYVLYVRHQGRDVRGSTVDFIATDVPSARPPAARETPATPRPRSPRASVDRTVAWPTYGYDASRVRSTSAFDLRPPFRPVWTFHGRALLEFPPAVAYGRVYLPTFDGRFYALDARTGKTIWHVRTGRCVWASPAVHGGLVFETFIGHACNAAVPGSNGEVLAFDAASGRIRWRRLIGPTESSPLVAKGLVYVGDWTGRVYALSETTGRIRWTFTTGGAIKGSAAIADGHLYIGSYDGHVYALSARTGRRLWVASGQPRIGSSGRFYSTPAVAYGRVYIGSTDGKVYSLSARTGALRWSHHTGGYVYASPAIWHSRVLIGSYDHSFYAFDAATGDVRWRFSANGPISGSATVLNGVVYFSTFNERTYALDAATGRLRWTWPDGKYSPVVSDARQMYLTGLGRLYAMVEKRSKTSSLSQRR